MSSIRLCFAPKAKPKSKHILKYRFNSELLEKLHFFGVYEVHGNVIKTYGQGIDDGDDNDVKGHS